MFKNASRFQQKRAYRPVLYAPSPGSDRAEPTESRWDTPGIDERAPEGLKVIAILLALLAAVWATLWVIWKTIRGVFTLGAWLGKQARRITLRRAGHSVSDASGEARTTGGA